MACLLFYTSTTAQVRLEGKVRDTSGNPIPDVSVSIVKKSNGAGILFTKTDQAGKYVLTVENTGEVTGLFIKVTAIGYQKAEKNILPSVLSYDFVLTIDPKLLNEVVVKNKGPIVTQKGDTLNFRVADFAGKNDRMIADVLQKIPGIEVDKNGKIKYNGRYINNFFIEGDDLLADKYNTATRNIPSDLVDKIQVLENNQPVKVLSNIQSGGTAINITLKDKAKIKPINNVQVGGGYRDVYDMTFTSLLFKNTYKSINVFKKNNIGIDPSEQVTSLNLSEFLLQYENNSKTTFLSESVASPPDISKQRYLFNNSNFLNLNHLFKLNNDVQLRFNGSMLIDKQQRNYRQTTDIFLLGDTVSYEEIQSYTDRSKTFNPEINLTINKNRYFLTNNTSLRFEYHDGGGKTMVNGNGIQQALTNDQQSFSNTLKALYAFKNRKIIEINSYITYTNEPQYLSIRPGLYEDLFSTGGGYESLRHVVKAPLLFTNNFIAARQRIGKTILTAKTGFLLQDQTFRSFFETNKSGSYFPITNPDFINNLQWRKTKLYAEPQLRYVHQRTEVNFSAPASIVSIHAKDSTHQYKNSTSRFFIEPALRWQYKVGKESSVYSSYSYNNRLGTMDDVYRGNILQNYRSFTFNDAPIQEINNHTVGAGFIYKKAIKIFFANFSASYTSGTKNVIFSSEIQDNITKRIALPVKNNYSSVLIAGAVSKYLFPLKSTINLKYNYQLNSTNQIQNNVLLRLKENVHFIKGAIRITRIKFITFNYEGSYLYSYTKQRNQLISNQGIGQFKQLAEVDFFPADRLSMKLTAEHTSTSQSYNSQKNFFFSDVTARYRLAKPNIELELTAFNITNLKYYNVLAVSENSIFKSAYELRPRFILLKASFSF
ncbi:TonB-dependent receptor [Pseudoflavitalea sp. X16]|uniref:carboxypeptidase regulatory-like domain-containing protein n=1 Tax=Paraflavitalea devenefica TaxID=2716334 RepID=UPI00142457BF|nr:carboxypeptidase regulatory-like domain-containing protein [Paraflavitalea devenefica]NII25921.1 TonB-dependent receptor [Paraflavitalea devenefica]